MTCTECMNQIRSKPQGVDTRCGPSMVQLLLRLRRQCHRRRLLWRYGRRCLLRNCGRRCCRGLSGGVAGSDQTRSSAMTTAAAMMSNVFLFMGFPLVLLPSMLLHPFPPSLLELLPTTSESESGDPVAAAYGQYHVAIGGKRTSLIRDIEPDITFRCPAPFSDAAEEPFVARFRLIVRTNAKAP